MQKNAEVPVLTERIIGLVDYISLAHLLIAPGTAMPPEVRSSFLKALDLAVIVDPEHVPGDVVRIGSALTLLDCSSREERRCVLDWGRQAASPDCISVLTPLGSVLIGASEGTAVSHRTLGGDVRLYRILSVQNDAADRGIPHEASC